MHRGSPHRCHGLSVHRQSTRVAAAVYLEAGDGAAGQRVSDAQRAVSGLRGDVAVGRESRMRDGSNVAHDAADPPSRPRVPDPDPLAVTAVVVLGCRHPPPVEAPGERPAAQDALDLAERLARLGVADEDAAGVVVLDPGAKLDGPVAQGGGAVGAVRGEGGLGAGGLDVGDEGDGRGGRRRRVGEVECVDPGLGRVLGCGGDGEAGEGGGGGWAEGYVGDFGAGDGVLVLEGEVHP